MVICDTLISLFHNIVPLCVFQILGLCPVAFIVRFPDHEKTIFIAELVKIRSIWIMAAAHCIKVMLFHHDQIFLCLSDIDNRTRHRIAVMTVYALELDLFTIDVNDASLLYSECHSIHINGMLEYMHKITEYTKPST